MGFLGVTEGFDCLAAQEQACMLRGKIGRPNRRRQYKANEQESGHDSRTPLVQIIMLDVYRQKVQYRLLRKLLYLFVYGVTKTS